MKYVLLIYSNPASREVWEALPTERRLAGLRAYRKLDADLEASGELLAAQALDQSKATRVLVKDGRTIPTDGPFAEAKEILAGFYLLDCEDLDRAIEHAARIPEAAYGLVEVRPVLDLSAFET